MDAERTIKRFLRSSGEGDLYKEGGSGDEERLEGFERYSSGRINRTWCSIICDGWSGGIKGISYVSGLSN